MFTYIIINDSVQSTISNNKKPKKEHVNYKSIAFSDEKGLKSYIRPCGALCWL